MMLAALLLAAAAPSEIKIDSATFGAVEARSIGPAVMSGRIAAIDGSGRDPRVLYAGAAGGGVWKTTNGGTTFKPVFDRYIQSIGAIAVDQGKPDTVWVGTGESWVRNSVSAGNGVYKTTDGGDNWQYLGLPESERIARIAIDPKDANTVYVAVPGKLWSASEERGLYKTTDGGTTWQRILFVNPDTGCSDVAIDPQETGVLYAGMWQFRRYPWKFVSGGPGSGLYRSADGGKTWERLKAGLPEGELGRIALAVAPSRPSTVYALIESKKSALYRSDDMGRSWTMVNDTRAMGERPFYFSLIVPDPKDYRKIYKPGLGLSGSKDGGKTFNAMGASVTGAATHPDHHALWIDPANPETMYLGTDGGVYRSTGGATWAFLRNLPVSQFYHVSFDLERPYNVFGGLQDNGSWMGPSESAGGVQNKDWRGVGYGDGFYVFAHPADRDVIYSQYQGGRFLRFHRSTGEIKAIAPRPKTGEPPYRFNWNAAVALSPSDPNVIYAGGQFLFRSRDKGESWEKISPDLTTNDPEKLKQNDSGGLTIDDSTAENHCTIYAIAESPLDRDVIWAGTDDGNLHVTRDGGKTWKNVIVPGVSRYAQVSSVEAGHFQPGVAYVTFDAHMSGDMKTYVFRTADFGATWSSIAAAPLKSYAHVVREDRVKPDLLFVGTEFGLFLTVDGGRQWAQFTGNLPSVAVRDLAIHPRDHALVVATHGRGIYIVDDLTPIRQITATLLDSDLAVLESQPAPVRLPVTAQSFPGMDEFTGFNPPEAAWITYYLKERHIMGDFKIEILDSEGKLVTTLPPGRRKGINRVPWPMRLRPPRIPTAPTLEYGTLFGPLAPEGDYTARIVKGDRTYTAAIRLVGDPRTPHSEADRKLQQKTVMAVYNRLEQLALAAETLTELEKRPALARQVEVLRQKLAVQREGRLSQEQRLREKLGELYSEVSRYGGRPTQSQLDRLKALEGEAGEWLRELDKLK